MSDDLRVHVALAADKHGRWRWSLRRAGVELTAGFGDSEDDARTRGSEALDAFQLQQNLAR